MKYIHLIPFLIIFFGSSLTFAQSDITGRVFDKKENPIAGVSIVVKNQKVGTITDSLGRFALPARQGDTLQVIWGRESLEIRVDRGVDLQIQMDRYPKNKATTYNIFSTPVPTTTLGAFESVDHTHFNPVHLTDPAQLVQGQFGGSFFPGPTATLRCRLISDSGDSPVFSKAMSR
jgi:hypothetical protein